MKSRYFKGPLLSFLILMGCGEKDLFEKKPEPQKETLIQQSLESQNVLIDVLPTAEPNKYSIIINWPKSLGSLVISEQGNEIFKTAGKSNSFNFVKEGGSEFELDFQQLTAGGEKMAEIKRKIQVPSDKVFTGKTVLTSDFVFKGGRLFWIGNASVETQTFNVDIQADEIISENGSLYTFPEGLTAAVSVPGRSAGNVTILTKSARGNLNISMRGEIGGRGRHSVCNILGDCNSQGGLPGGNAGFLTFQSGSSQNFDLKVNMLPGKGGGIGYPCAGSTYDPLSITNIRNNNCEGFGTGGSNGPIGPAGTGLACWQLSAGAPRECK